LQCAEPPILVEESYDPQNPRRATAILERGIRERVRTDTKHLFVDGLNGHRYLFSVYAMIEESQLLALSDSWRVCERELDSLEASLTPSLESLTFLTLESLVYCSHASRFIEMLDRIDVPVHGILHHPPNSSLSAALLREAASNMASVLTLAEPLGDKLRTAYGLKHVRSLPHHPVHADFLINGGSGHVRRRIGALPGDFVISVLGEARKGKGIELLLEALDHIPSSDRLRLFLLFGGRAQDFEAREIEAKLREKGYRGHADLRPSADPLNYAVLSEREFAEYVSAADAGLLLYQEEQRARMSGILPDYVWARKPVIATARSIAGELVREHRLGTTLTLETPRELAETISTALRAPKHGAPPEYERFRETIAPDRAALSLASVLGEGRRTKRLKRTYEIVVQHRDSFNIVHYADKFYALAQSIGPLDLQKLPRQELERYQGESRCLIGDSLHEVKHRLAARRQLTEPADILSRVTAGQRVIVGGILDRAEVQSRIESQILSSFGFLDRWKFKQLEREGLARMHAVLTFEEIARAVLAANDSINRMVLSLTKRIVKEGLGYSRRVYLKKEAMTRYIVPFDVLNRHESSAAHRAGKGCCAGLQNGMIKQHGPHKDSWYDMAMDGINIWAAFTDVQRGNSMTIYPDCWRKPIRHRGTEIERSQALGRHESYTLKAGECLLFNGDHLHSTELNVTDMTRVVVTFRFSLEQPAFDELDRKDPTYYDSRFVGTPLQEWTKQPHLLSRHRLKRGLARLASYVSNRSG